MRQTKNGRERRPKNHSRRELTLFLLLLLSAEAAACAFFLVTNPSFLLSFVSPSLPRFIFINRGPASAFSSSSSFFLKFLPGGWRRREKNSVRRARGCQPSHYWKEMEILELKNANHHVSKKDILCKTLKKCFRIPIPDL